MEAILAALTKGIEIETVSFFKEGKDSTGQGEKRTLQSAVVEGVKTNKEGFPVCTVKAEGSYKAFSVRCVTKLILKGGVRIH